MNLVAGYLLAFVIVFHNFILFKPYYLFTMKKVLFILVLMMSVLGVSMPRQPKTTEPKQSLFILP